MLTHQAGWNPPIRMPWRFLPGPSGGGRRGRAVGDAPGPVRHVLNPPGRYPVETLEPCAAKSGRPRCAVEADTEAETEGEGEGEAEGEGEGEGEAEGEGVFVGVAGDITSV